ncbi:MAG: 16S rRNA (cytosine(967)-C(5))-methyltransferase RsmB [Xanthomonadaceae bacterium]|nr:16S rRNA (cytosine(967)-C(5))-methyltransferase RsmB [Xanthomonadaceae bacterium]
MTRCWTRYWTTALDALRADWPADWEAITVANNSPAPMTLRARERDAYLTELTAAGIAAMPAPHARDGIVLDESVGVDVLPGFADGRVSVQDASAQLAADLVDAAPGMRVLDACAAPGGKACHLLERTPDLTLVAVERDARRLTRVHENLARLRLAATVVHGDAATPGAWWDGKPFDRILLDAPCSATGVIRRHPDIRLLRRESDIPALAELQRELLAALWPLLAPGGVLVYATCSVLAAENDAAVDAFIAAQPGASATPFAAEWGHPTLRGRQVLPGQDGMDGFYYACLRHVDAR